MAKENTERYCYVYSCDLKDNLQIKIGSLEGHDNLKSELAIWDSDVNTLSCNQLFVTCHVVSGKHILTLPAQTSYKYLSNRLNWQEWLTLPIAYCNLPRDAELIFSIYGLNKYGKRFLFGETSTEVFCKYGTLQKGMLDLKVTPTAYGLDESNEMSSDYGTVKLLAEMTNKYREGRIEKVDWLDRLTFREIETINERYKRVSKLLYLMVDFPEVFLKDTKFDVVYFEEGGDTPCPYLSQPSIISCYDTTLSMKNLVEDKHHVLARTVRSNASDRDMKPDAVTRDILHKIVCSLPTAQLSSGEQDLLWKFRYFLSSEKLALTKFLKCVNWNNEQESRAASDLMQMWEPINVEDSLELLSPSFSEPAVRQYAVSRLMQADDEELLLYLLQLVQAIRYEDVNKIRTALVDQAVTAGVTQDVLNEALADDHEITEKLATLNMTDDVDTTDIHPELINSTVHDLPNTADMDIVGFLIHRASNNFDLANYLYWYLKVEAEGSESHTMKNDEVFGIMLQRFIHTLKKSSPNIHNKLVAQQNFLDKLLQLIHDLASSKLDRKKKTELIPRLLAEPERFGKDFVFTSFEPFPLPLNPDKLVKGVIPDQTYLFKSAMCPIKLTFITTSEEQYTVIFKSGDDLRQDQLVLQMVHLMDKLLRKENLDLKLKPYRVLATSSKHGFIEFVPSQALAEIQETDGSILNYLKKHAPAETPSGISNEVMETYIRSCAGYCVITYLLGVGDRHLDNLMLTTTGHLFHIDFGFILGRDPKPMPPPMKLTKEMVDAMGGPSSEHYKTFTDLCFSAFFHLRRSANLILNLFSLMVDANIPDIVLEPDKTVKKVQEKFLLNLTDEEAAKEMKGLLEDSVSALMPAIAETLHKLAQYMRK